MEEVAEIVVGTLDIAAVAVFDPLRTSEELAHLAVVGPGGEMFDEIDELVGLVVVAVPFKRHNFLWAHLAR